MSAFEPCQVRNEAALKLISHVPWISCIVCFGDSFLLIFTLLDKTFKIIMDYNIYGVTMGAKDKTEEALKKIHIFMANAEEVQDNKTKVIVDKNEFMGLLKSISDCMLDMMEEYDISKDRRDKIDRETKIKSEKIKDEAKRDAEDIYAASIMYTDEALRSIIKVIDDTNKKMRNVLISTSEMLSKQREVIQNNQMELVSKLETLRDTKKYIKLIKDENIRLKEEEERKEKDYDDIVSKEKDNDIKIRVDTDYLSKLESYKKNIESKNIDDKEG